jgi:uncharacterized phage-like protein YoqJ
MKKKEQQQATVDEIKLLAQNKQPYSIIHKNQYVITARSGTQILQDSIASSRKECIDNFMNKERQNEFCFINCFSWRSLSTTYGFSCAKVTIHFEINPKTHE